MIICRPIFKILIYFDVFLGINENKPWRKKKNVKGQSSYLTMNNLEKDKRRDVFFLNTAKNSEKLDKWYLPIKLLLASSNWRWYLQIERLEKMDGVLYKGVFIKKYIKRPPNEKA